MLPGVEPEFRLSRLHCFQHLAHFADLFALSGQPFPQKRVLALRLEAVHPAEGDVQISYYRLQALFKLHLVPLHIG